MKKLLGVFSGWTPAMFWIRGTLLAMVVAFVMYMFSLQSKIDDLNVQLGEHTAAIDICEIDKKTLRDKITTLELSIEDYKGSWEDQKEKTKNSEDIINALNQHTKKLIRDLRNSPRFETCQESVDWMLSTVLKENIDE